MVQVPPFAGMGVAVVQVGVRAKSPAAPAADVRVTTALVYVTAAVVLLVRVTVCAGVAAPMAVELNESEDGDAVKSAGAVPVSATVCGLEESLSTIVSVADSEVVDAVKITLSVQDIPAGMEVPQDVL